MRRRRYERLYVDQTRAGLLRPALVFDLVFELSCRDGEIQRRFEGLPNVDLGSVWNVVIDPLGVFGGKAHAAV